ncbi:STAS domain-containing protein [Lentzea sp. NPDC092896]|uniref:STAS domain-containing protein n=1 Tax=Lentzea sp. NPDC092896 TaxID=3364127 RepID=UPI003826139B
MSQQSGGSADVLTAHTEVHDGIEVVVVAGEIDRMTDAPLGVALDVLGRGPAGLVIDLAAVTFFGSAGVNMLVTVLRAAKAGRVPFAVIARKPTVLRPLAITGVDAVLPLHPDLAGALAALRSVPSQRRR